MRKQYSFSRRIVLDTCLMQYFLQYHAADKKCLIDPGLKSEIRKLKALSNCDMLAGKFLEAQIRLHLVRGADWSPSWFLRKALGDFDRAILQNRKLAVADETPSAGRLLEFAVGDPQADEKAAKAREKLSIALDHYFNATSMVALRESTKGAALTVGKKISGLQVRDWTISGEIDLLIVHDETVRIIDWKIGMPQMTMDSLQLFIYGWYAANEPMLRGRKITAQRAFLGTGELESPTEITPERTCRGRARVLQDIELMNELDPYGREGVEEVFTPCMNENICRRCKFQTMCPKGTAPLASKPTSDFLPLFQALT